MSGPRRRVPVVHEERFTGLKVQERADGSFRIATDRGRQLQLGEYRSGGDAWGQLYFRVVDPSDD